MAALYKNATTTQAARLAIQQSTGGDFEVAACYGTSRGTERNWPARDCAADGWHTQHRPSARRVGRQEALAIDRRRKLRPSVDDLLSAAHEFIHRQMSRSALDRLQRRRGELRLPETVKPTAPSQPVKAHEPVYVQPDVEYLLQIADACVRCNVFIAIDLDTCRVLCTIATVRTAAAAGRHMNTLASKVRFKLNTALTDNDTECTHQLFGRQAKTPSGEHDFDCLCEALDIDHRLARAIKPQTSGMVERFNGRVEQIAHPHRIDAAEYLHTPLDSYLSLYNGHLQQKALRHVASAPVLKHWHKSCPVLVRRKVRNQLGPNILKINPRRFRPKEVKNRTGDRSKARAKLGLASTASVDSLKLELLGADENSARRDELVLSTGLQADDRPQ